MTELAQEKDKWTWKGLRGIKIAVNSCQDIKDLALRQAAWDFCWHLWLLTKQVEGRHLKALCGTKNAVKAVEMRHRLHQFPEPEVAPASNLDWLHREKDCAPSKAV